jgi:hypothetical protein
MSYESTCSTSPLGVFHEQHDRPPDRGDFGTNTDEGKLLSNGTGDRQQQIALRLKDGVQNYFTSSP